ncbi:MAG: c-type cytochrome [Alphaproteobacteria bacterium]
MKSTAVHALTLSVLLVGSAGSAMADGDPVRGEELFRQCMACHSLNEGENRVGPSLYGMFGREAGTVDRYNYTPAMRDSGIVWTADTLDAHLADPRGFIPGNRMGMTFPRGVSDAQDRADLISYLEQATAPQ